MQSARYVFGGESSKIGPPLPKLRRAKRRSIFSRARKTVRGAELKMRTPSVRESKVSTLVGSERAANALDFQLVGAFGVVSSEPNSEKVGSELCELPSSEHVEACQSSSRRDSAELKDSHGSSLAEESRRGERQWSRCC